jgi:hypothetical protein
VLLGVASVAPALYALVFVFLIFPGALRTVRDPSNADPSAIQTQFLILAGAHVAMMLVALAVMVGFAAHLYRSSLDPARKMIWAFALIFGNVFVAPVYYFVFFTRAHMEKRP